jgi:hypothetical protein
VPKAGSNTRQPRDIIVPWVTRDMDHRKSVEDLENGKEFIVRNGLKLHQRVLGRNSGGDHSRSRFEKFRTCIGSNCDESVQYNYAAQKIE